MANHHPIKKDSLYPRLEVEIRFTEDSKDIGDALSVVSPITFTMVSEDDGTTKIDAAAASILSVANGLAVLAYDWSSGDTDTAGTFRGTFTATTTSSKPFEIPPKGWYRVVVDD